VVVERQEWATAPCNWPYGVKSETARRRRQRRASQTDGLLRLLSLSPSMMAASSAMRRAPPLPYPDDGLPTETSRTQADTEDVLLGHFPASGATPTLNMETHKQWLARNLIQGFPARYQAYDCSQPWLSYWTLQAFCAIGIGMDPASSQRCVRGRSHAVWSALSQALVGSSTRS
jgi:hypothetical protein